MSQKITKEGKMKGGNDDIKQEDLLTAVLIADSFCNRFRPLDETQPKALLPLVNRPMIEYSLESLLLSRVHITYVYCVSHADQIRHYLKNSRWVEPDSPMRVEVLSQSPDDCHSLGDALRDLEGKGLIRGDFIILSADVVSNVQLKPILEKHRERRKADKGLIMTHVFKKLFPGHRTRALDEELILAVNPATGRILHYQPTSHIKKLNFPLEIFKESSPIQLRYDLTDTHISICSNTVLPLFADNFDYQTWSDFVKGILINEEILGNTIYCHELEGSYAAQVSSVPMYDAVSQDIIQRWTTPLVPDLSAGNGVLRHTLSRHNVYKQPQVTLSRGCVLESNVVVGEHTSVGEKAFVTHSVIGRNCTIGKNVSISHAYIWDNVEIMDNCRIDLAIIASHAVIEEGVELGRGCVVGPGVRLTKGTKIPPNTRLVAQPPIKDDSFECSDEEEYPVAPVSAGSAAYVYVNKNEDSDVDSIVNDLWDLNFEEDSEDEDEEELNSEDDEGGFDAGEFLEENNEKRFYDEVLESLQRGFEEKIKGDNLILEINSSKYAYNITVSEVNSLVTKAMLSLPNIVSEQAITGPKQYWTALQPIMKHFLPILRNYLKNRQSQLDCLHAFDDFGTSNGHFAQTISSALHFLYDSDVLEEEVILKWHSNPPNDPSAKDSVRKFAAVFIKWLEDADEESEDS